MKIIVATSNPHKVQEIEQIAEIIGIKGIEFTPIPKSLKFDPVENGKTFEENAIIKALEANRLTGEITLADDSGLCVEALNGGPGIYSARYAETPQQRINKLLENLKDKQNRKAKFVCAMVLVSKDGKVIFKCTGECKGKITEKQSGLNGFGYDPVFFIEESSKTMAEMPEIEKNKISHRSRALKQILDFLRK